MKKKILFISVLLVFLVLIIIHDYMLQPTEEDLQAKVEIVRFYWDHIDDYNSDIVIEVKNANSYAIRVPIICTYTSYEPTTDTFIEKTVSAEFDINNRVIAECRIRVGDYEKGAIKGCSKGWITFVDATRVVPLCKDITYLD